MELLDISKTGQHAFIVSCDNTGNVNWHQVTNVTRHDPSEYIYKIKTKWGREVSVVASKSLLVWNSITREFEPKDSCDVVVGDKLPVTFNTPINSTNTYVDMRNYLSDTEYIYGSDYNKSLNKQITKKFDILDNQVYLKCARRNSPSLPDKFELNRQNGFFIGIYLAEGNTCKDYIGIANNDKDIRDIVQKWFEDNNIIHKTQVKKFNPERPGLSTTIRGYSTILVQFLESFVGKYSNGKYVPNEAYTAPDEFVKGLIDGYISGDGCVTQYHVVVSSVSKDLISGVSTLLTRFGIFSKISRIQQKKNNVGSKNIQPRYNLSIQSKYVHKFGEVFTLSHQGKQEKLELLMQKKTLTNMGYLYEEVNDVMLDNIVSIEKVKSEANEKVYDMTVPGTLNFQIFNGLNMYDTSETGYIQRKLVKAMEDCKINYDYTVRNANGAIIQFLYGEDGMDPIKIEAQALPYIDMDYQKLSSDYLLTKDDDLRMVIDEDLIKGLKSNWDEPFKKHFDQVVKDREFMIIEIFKRKQNNSFMYPVSFARIINNARAMMGKYKVHVPSDINPQYILDTIESVGKELYINKVNRADKFINIMLRAHLSPKQVLFNYKFNKDVFDYVIQQVKLRFFEALAHPSEMVGVIAAQSIGEPCTQLSAAKDTKIIVYKKNGDSNVPFKTTIGDFIDKVLEENKDKVVDLGNNSVVYDPTDDYNIIGVSDTEKTSWNRILQVSRHPANGGMVRVKTRSGKTTCATLSHSFLKRSADQKVVPIEGSKLEVGDRIPVSKYIPEVENALKSLDGFELDRDFGWLCGVYLADGHVNYHTISISKVIPEFVDHLTRIVKDKFEQDIRIKSTERTMDIQKNGKWNKKKYLSQDNLFTNKTVAKFLVANFGSDSNSKHVPGWAYTSNLEFIKGLIGGYFDGDGNVANSEGKGMIRAHSVSETLIEDVLLLLNYVGIFGTKALEVKKEEHLQNLHTIQISRKYAETFKKQIGFVVESKIKCLDEVIGYVNDTHHDEKEYIDKIPELGSVIASIGKALQLRGQSRNYGRWTKKPSIGRNTLIKYIDQFSQENKIQNIPFVNDQIQILRQAAYSDVIWDEIVGLEYLDDPQEFVYDFTVPGNDSFMVDCGVLVHNTLNTFHSSGISSASKAVRGVPRIKELLSVTKNIKAPSMSIYIKDEFKKDKMKSNEVLKSIQTTFFKDIVKSSKIYYDASDFTTEVEDDKVFIDSYRELMDLDLVKNFDTAPWLLRIEVNREKLLEEGINMITLYNILQDYYEDTITCMFSDDNSGNLIFRIRLIDEPSQEEGRDYITELKALEKNIMENILIKGTKNVKKSMMNKQSYQLYNEDTLKFEDAFEWVLDTSGTNMVDVMCHPRIDYTKTISNDINEIYDLLGIEAARNALYAELSSVISDAELYVNYRHIALLVDTMTNKGYLLSIDRHGINRVDIGPLAKCSFEETTDMLVKAGIHSEVDKITGVSANIMLGQIPPCGTGDAQILIDEHKLLNNLNTPTTNDSEDHEEYADVCTFDNLSFDFRLPAPTDNTDVNVIKDFDLNLV